MNEQFHNDDILFDRLVDGELSTAERRELLLLLDKRPEAWRKCALAFLEAQEWKKELQSLAAKPATYAATASVIALKANSQRTATIRATAQWLAVAAALLIAFKFGAMQRQTSVPMAGAPAKTNEQIVSSHPSVKPLANPTGKPGDALNLWVRNDAGQLQRVRVPLVDAKALDDELGLQFQTGVPDDIRNRLEGNGYAVQSKRQYAPMWLDNGRPMIVPVEDTKIVPVSNKVY
jgi:hypothetical protein